MSSELVLSPLPKTWVFDLDGTIVKHNGHLHGGDTLLPGVADFFASLNPEDVVIILTARESRYKDELLSFLRDHAIKYHQIIFDMPKGERILINDMKPSGLQTAYAINIKRDSPLNIKYSIDESL
jgi:ribonucleotide monophosphatase NagD (HAD superfamily)